MSTEKRKHPERTAQGCGYNQHPVREAGRSLAVPFRRHCPQRKPLLCLLKMGFPEGFSVLHENRIPEHVVFCASFLSLTITHVKFIHIPEHSFSVLVLCPSPLLIFTTYLFILPLVGVWAFPALVYKEQCCCQQYITHISMNMYKHTCWDIHRSVCPCHRICMCSVLTDTCRQFSKVVVWVFNFLSGAYLLSYVLRKRDITRSPLSSL